MLGFHLEIRELPRRSLVASALLTASLALGLKFVGAFQAFDLALWDLWLRSRPRDSETEARVVIVDVTEAEIQRIGDWPLPDAIAIEAINQIEASQPRAIGLIAPNSLAGNPGPDPASRRQPDDADPSRFVPTAPIATEDAKSAAGLAVPAPALETPIGDSLIDLFDRLPHLVGAFDSLYRDEISPRLVDRQLGAMDVQLDLDGQLRRNLISVRADDWQPHASFALSLSLLYLQYESIEPHSLHSDLGWFQFGKTRIAPLSPNAGGYVRAQRRGYHIPLVYRLPPRDFPRLTLSELREGRYDPALLRDRVVIFGTSAPRFDNAYETPIENSRDRSDPLQNLPNLWVQAQATQHLLSIALRGKGSVSTVPEWIESIATLAWVGLGLWGNTQIAKRWTRETTRRQWNLVWQGALVVAIGGGAVTVAIAWGAMSAGVWFPVGSLLAGLWSSTLAVVLLQIRNLRQHDEDVTTILDVTLQHAESVEGQLVQDSERQRHESTMQSQQVLDAIPVGVALFDARGRLEYVNDRARILLGEPLLEKLFSDGIAAEDFARTCGLYDKRTGELCTDDRLPVTLALQGKTSYNHELELQTLSPLSKQVVEAAALDTGLAAIALHDRIPIEGWGQPIYSLTGSIQNAIFVFQDTIARQAAWNERLQLTTELEMKNEALQETDRLKDEFLKRTTHELRTPLNGIIGSLQIVLDDLCDDRFEERELLDQANQSALHLFDIVNDILDFSNIKSGQVVLDLRCVDLHACLTQSLYLQLSGLRQKKLQLVKQYCASAIGVRVDPIRLKQVFLNTIGNAIKFTEQGSITISTRLDARVLPSGEAETVAIVEICDTGIGVDPAIQPKLFEAFAMADGSSTRRYGGSGLGLAICHQLLDLMGGAIELHSDGQDCGTTVRIRLPVSDEYPGATDATETTNPIATTP